MKRRGFSIKWSEVCIIAAILVLLGFVFMPVRTDQGTPAPRSACLSNLRQLALAATMYASDSNDRFPMAATWHDELTPYSKNEDVFHCMAVTRPGYGYAYHRAVAGRREKDFRNPAQEAMFFDSSILTRDAVSDLTSLPQPGRHKGQNNIAYVDMHARSIELPIGDR